VLTLTDNWFVVRYMPTSGPAAGVWSDWTPPQLGEGWIKRVVGEINPFTQRAGGGGIAGAEESFTAFTTSTEPNRIVSMISQAGPRWTGNLPLNCDNLDDFGLIPIYETVLGRGMDLSIDAPLPVDNPQVNTALLLVASRLADLYTLLGNEAYADAADPTIGFGTDDGVYGAEATSIHCFMNQTSSLLEEELALLRGRDDTYAPGVKLYPLYNRLIWNFTNDMTGGEVAYALNYNIRDDIEEGNGVISEADAKRLYPQGHGDAWGQYLTAIMAYYKLLAHPFYTWDTRSEALLVGGQPVTVDYLDERKFASVAAAKARTGSEIVNLTYRSVYVEAPGQLWQGYTDTETYQGGFAEWQDAGGPGNYIDWVYRGWGLSEWASRAGQGTYFDWVVGNAILPAEDPDPEHTGIQKIDRTTVLELREVADAYDSIQTQIDMADLGLNPIGLGTNVIPFDIDPNQIDEGMTHFEQIYTRAVTALNNAVSAFNNANNCTQLLRRQSDSYEEFERSVLDTELDYKSRLIEIFGYPYDDDIGAGGTYERGYDGPDLYHYMYTEESGLYRDEELDRLYFRADSDGVPSSTDIPAIAENVALQEYREQYEDYGAIEIGTGDLAFEVNVVNYLGVNRDYDFGQVSASFGNVMAQILASVVSSHLANLGYDPYDPFGALGNSATEPNSDLAPSHYFTVDYNMSTRGGAFGVKKPETWTGKRRALGEIQLTQLEVNQTLARFMTAINDYEGLVGEIKDKAALVEAQYGVNAHKLFLVDRHRTRKEVLQDVLLVYEAVVRGFKSAYQLVQDLKEAGKESVPTVMGTIVGFSNGVIMDPTSLARGGISMAGAWGEFALRALADIADLIKMRLEQAGELSEVQLNVDTTELEGKFSNMQAILELDALVGNEVKLRIALHSAHDAMVQAIGEYTKTLAEGQRLVDRLTIFRRQTASTVQTNRYNDMAFRLFRNSALQKYRAQFDLAARYTYLAAKAYDYETTMLSSDPMAGQQFLTEIVRARQLGTVVDGVPQTGEGLADSLAVMSRNFDVLYGQLGFNNPQVETNRFSLRHELFRCLPDSSGDETWQSALNKDYWTYDYGLVDNLWDVPEFGHFCVPPAGFAAVEPGLVIPFSTTIEEGKNFFGMDIGSQDSSYDSTQFATKIRSVGIWFSNYDILGLSNTPRVYLVPVGNDVLRAPSGARGYLREFTVLDQILPVPFPIGAHEMDDPSWIPSIDSLSGQLGSIRRFGRLRAYHDSGEFRIDEVNRDSRLIGRSVWNRRWMLIIPGSTFSADSVEGLQRFINGRMVDGQRDGNGVSDIKMFFETYAYPRLNKLKSAGDSVPTSSEE